MAILGFRDAANAPFSRLRGGHHSPVFLRMLRKALPTDRAHRRRPVRARAKTGGAEKTQGRVGDLPGPPRAVPHLPAGGAGPVRPRFRQNGEPGRGRGGGGVRRLPAPLPRGPEGPRRPVHEGHPALAAVPPAREGPGEAAGGDQGVHAVPRAGAGLPARAAGLREDPRVAQPAGPARSERGGPLPHQETVRQRRGTGPAGGRGVPRRAGRAEAPLPACAVAREAGEEGGGGDLPEDAGGGKFRTPGEETVSRELAGLIRMGKNAYSEADCVRAERHLLDALAGGAKYPDIHYTLGLIDHQRGNYRRAAEQFGQAGFLKPDYIEAVLSLSS